jgi:V-type H+-transporting ATPase subunit d
MQMVGTEFGCVMSAAGTEAETITVSYFDEKMREKLLVEFDYVRSHAVWPLTEFLDYMT